MSWSEHRTVYGQLAAEADEEFRFFYPDLIEEGQIKTYEIVAYMRGNFDYGTPYIWILKIGDRYRLIVCNADYEDDADFECERVWDALDHIRCLFKDVKRCDRAFMILGKQMFGRTFSAEPELLHFGGGCHARAA